GVVLLLALSVVLLPLLPVELLLTLGVELPLTLAVVERALPAGLVLLPPRLSVATGAVATEALALPRGVALPVGPCIRPLSIPSKILTVLAVGLCESPLAVRVLVAELARGHHRAPGTGAVHGRAPPAAAHLRAEERDAVAVHLVATAPETVQPGQPVARHVVVIPADVLEGDTPVEVVAAVEPVAGAVAGQAEERAHPHPRHEEVEQVHGEEGPRRYEEVRRGRDAVGVVGVAVAAVVPVAAAIDRAALIALVVVVGRTVLIVLAVIVRGTLIVVPRSIVVPGTVIVTGSVVRPRSIAGVHVGAGGQRSPADVVVAFLPGDPGRSPVVAGNPGPADLRVLIPAAVVVGRPSIRLVGEPGPTLVAPDPVTGLIAAPARGHVARRPDPPVARALDPVAVGGETVVEKAEVDGGVASRTHLDPRTHRKLGGGRSGADAQEEKGEEYVT